MGHLADGTPIYFNEVIVGYAVVEATGKTYDATKAPVVDIPEAPLLEAAGHARVQ